MNETLQQLASELLIAKATEDNAKEQRIKAEQDIIDLIGCKENGSETHDTERYKVTTKGGYLYACDMDALEGLDIEPRLRPVKTEVKFDPKGYKWLQENESEVFKKVATVVTVKPTKSSVTVKVK